MRLQCSTHTYHKNLLLSTGMAGKDEVGNALLGGSSDYLVDLASHLTTTFFASNEEKVSMLVFDPYRALIT